MRTRLRAPLAGIALLAGAVAAGAVAAAAAVSAVDGRAVSAAWSSPAGRAPAAPPEAATPGAPAVPPTPSAPVVPAPPGAPALPDAPPVSGAPAASEPAPVTIGPEETAALHQLARHASWVRRMAATMRLEAWPATGAAELLTQLAADPDSRVRASAVAALAVLGTPVPTDRLRDEPHPRVVRTMLRCGAPLDAERVEAGARALLASAVPGERLLGVEIVAALDASGRAPRGLQALGRQTFSSVVARLDRETAGTLSPRLALLTGAPDTRVDFKWRSWLGRNSISYKLDGGRLSGEGAERPRNAVAELPAEEFVRFAAAFEEAFRKPIDLGIALDCTASMAGELAQAQAGIHDVMEFAAAAAGGMRVAVVGYRDQGDEWTTRWWNFTGDRAEARANLWQLRADGGGDEPELVHEGLKIAYGQFAWRRGEGVQRIQVLVGDAPPQPGFGGRCVELARTGLAAGITTYVISTRDERREEEVKHFVEIARAGGGRVIRLSAKRDLAAELAGVALADTWHDPLVAIFERFLLVGR